jgi:hypothetical protein
MDLNQVKLANLTEAFSLFTEKKIFQKQLQVLNAMLSI